MGQQRFTPEFKDEAVRQVTERGYKREITDRAGDPATVCLLMRLGLVRRPRGVTN